MVLHVAPEQRQDYGNLLLCPLQILLCSTIGMSICQSEKRLIPGPEMQTVVVIHALHTLSVIHTYFTSMHGSVALNQRANYFKLTWVPLSMEIALFCVGLAVAS